MIDFSRHRNSVLEVNTEELWARVQPGLVQDELNAHVRPLGLLFGPDTSTSNRATLGGMMGNNSGGSHSIAYGLTVEHVIEMTVLLADGSRVVFGEVTEDQFDAKCRATGLEGDIYREMRAIRDEYEGEIRARYPKHWRRVAGYNLNELVKDGPLNMARVVVGSEGTLLTILEAKVRLVRRPKKTALEVIHYRDIRRRWSVAVDPRDSPYAWSGRTSSSRPSRANRAIERMSRAGVRCDLIVEFRGDRRRGAVEERALDARRQREGLASPPRGLEPASSIRLNLRKAGLACYGHEWLQEPTLVRTPRRSQAPCAFGRCFREISPGTTPPEPTTALLVGLLHIRPVSTSRPGGASAGARHRTDHELVIESRTISSAPRRRSARAFLGAVAPPH